MIKIQKDYQIKLHPITGEQVRVHGQGALTYSFIGKRGTGYQGRGKQISTIGVTPDKKWYNIATGEIQQL